MYRQKTLKTLSSVSGVGVHTGEKVTLEFCPAPVGTGILFQRTDLPGKPKVPATVDFAEGVSRHTILTDGKVAVHTPEHVLSALFGCGVTNAVVRIDGAEPPICDGSAKEFVEAIKQAGVLPQDGVVDCITIKEPIVYSKGNVHLIALPSEGFRISYTLHYPHSPAIGSQYLSLEVNPETYAAELAPSRTFCLYEEVAPLLEANLIKGGSLDCAVVFRGTEVMGSEGLRYADEPVRHKICDMVGDLALVGKLIQGHVIAIGSGHKANVAFAKMIIEQTRGGSNND